MSFLDQGFGNILSNNRGKLLSMNFGLREFGTNGNIGLSQSGKTKDGITQIKLY